MSERRERMDARVVIVGAGPSGTATAAHLGQLGMDDVVLLDRHDFPRDKTCGSGISPKGIATLRDLGIWEAVERQAYRIVGLRLVTPGDREAYLSGGDEAAAVVCLRRVFDNILLERARSGGVRFVPHFMAETVIEEGGRAVGVRARDGREVRARHVIIAGGSHCLLTPTTRPRQTIQAIMGWWDNVPFRAQHLEMIFDRMLLPYYGWLFPESPTRVNIGITYEDPQGQPRHKARELFARFLDKHYGARLRGATQVGAFKGHPVVYSYAVEKLSAPGRLVVGEAGLMTHPATAEGIYQGMRSGIFAAEALAAIERGAAERTAHAAYEARCRRAFLASFWAGRAFRQVIRTPLLDWIVAAKELPILRTATARMLARL